jgi:hypothetical protein
VLWYGLATSKIRPEKMRGVDTCVLKRSCVRAPTLVGLCSRSHLLSPSNVTMRMGTSHTYEPGKSWIPLTVNQGRKTRLFSAVLPRSSKKREEASRRYLDCCA